MIIRPVAFVLLGLLAFGAPIHAEKVRDLGKTKFKDLAKYLELTPAQQEKIKPNVERIQNIVKDADKQRGQTGWGTGARRAPLGGGGVFGRPGAETSGGGEVMSPEKFEAVRTQRKEWQIEITNRADLIKSLLNPQQLEKFKTVQIPNVGELPSRSGWR